MSRRPAPHFAQHGVAAVELGIVLTLLVAITFGITELGRALYQYDTLTKSARAAARYLAVYDASNAGVRQRAVNVALCGVPDCSSAAPVVPNLTAANIRIDDRNSDPTLGNVSTGQGTIDLVRVTIGAPATAFPFESLVPFVVPSVTFGPIVAVMPQSFF